MTTNEQVLNSLPPVYFPNEINIVKKLFLPVSKVSNNFNCLSGYFSSKAISELAEPLSVLFKNPLAKGRFVISPNLSDEDKEALIKAYENEESIFDFLVGKDEITREALVTSTLEAIGYLIKKNRLDIRIALMKEGMMHAKIWLFSTTEGEVAIHGSGNATKSGLMTNFEQLVFSREWESKSNKTIIDSYQDRFNTFWDGRRDDSYTLKLNDKTISKILMSTKTDVSEEEFPNLLNKLTKHLENKTVSQRLTIPEWLNFRDGDYKHQGEAIDAWIEQGYKGTLEIATGGGKTLTSLVCASIAFESEEAGILVIAVPNKPLIKQWAEDVRNFSLRPVDTEGIGTKGIVRVIRRTIKEHEMIPQHSAIVLTHDALKTDEVKSVLSKYKNKIMLIGDEAHNLGSASFVDNPPGFIELRLALSATPERQYDPEGTLKLFDYFGPVVYEFSLEEAIGNCLVPFKYSAHKVYLNQEESDLWKEYTEKINSLLWSEDKETKKLVEQLQIRRRAISEGAENKNSAFKSEVSTLKSRIHSLAFCTDKSPEQLISVNDILREEGFLFHQITGDETSNKNLMQDVISSYKRGEIEILTSKKVLDEGFNIPPIKTAYFLASSGTVRTWVQRLGRVLRKSDDTGKKIAEIHDFIVFPPENTKEFKSLVSNELKRMQWFMSLAVKDRSLDQAISISNELLAIKELL
ncbi:DEAD/DEAH box helicase family protein [Pseudoalteromonas sp. L21]|uniref:DEAD/DEAH box helicase family protein n=1 Tax=Pseudoalteromonas sp. L21 TaxID=1539746 RepID=UPI001F18EC61|nr:DEAD/DEAH box helicase family protein [Pseudoalteromonas sp. L21]MCF7519385.1 DEAD/DEAH box helicase family protein [Pseudoalteromonas sp. L21]